MKSSFIAAAALLIAPVAVLAQLPAGLPECAAACLVNGIATNGCGTDIACNCKKQEFVNSVSACIASTCSASDATKSVEMAKQLCLSAQVTISVPGSAATGTATGTTTASASKTSSATVLTITTTSTGVSSTATVTNITTATGSATNTSASASATQTGNAASQYGLSIGAVGLAIAGFFAL
ncbi:hypothetical protein DFH27DRAFT_537000 [Peziza echinospora]|nr:hypothetical protein DFH27DRAFT_537000 [Peziza echinospora]